MFSSSCLRVDFVVQLGDAIDGRNASGGAEESNKALTRVLEVLNRYPVPRYDVIGNHVDNMEDNSNILSTSNFTHVVHIQLLGGPA